MAKEFNLNWSNGHVTRSGLPARIIGMDINKDTPLIAVIDFEDGATEAYSFTKDGKYDRDVESDFDLFNAEDSGAISLDWDVLNDSVKAVARNLNGEVWAFTDIPRPEGKVWAYGGRKFNISCLSCVDAGNIPWDESLVVRGDN